MISTHLIVDLAFCVGFAAVFNPARKLIKKFLSERSGKVEQMVEGSYALEERLDSMLSGISDRKQEVDLLAGSILKKAEERYRAIIENGKEEMERAMEAQIKVATDRIALQVDGFIKSLRMAAVDTASSIARSLLKEELDGGSEGGGGNGDVAAPVHEQDDSVKKLH